MTIKICKECGERINTDKEDYILIDNSYFYHYRCGIFESIAVEEVK